MSGLSTPATVQRAPVRESNGGSGTVALSILIGGFFYELARGHDGNPYGLILGVAG
jgi:hypothetical protein